MLSLLTNIAVGSVDLATKSEALTWKVDLSRHDLRSEPMKDPFHLRCPCIKLPIGYLRNWFSLQQLTIDLPGGKVETGTVQ